MARENLKRNVKCLGNDYSSLSYKTKINWHLMKIAGYIFRFFTGGERGKNHWHVIDSKNNLYKILRTGMSVCTKSRGMDPVFVYACAACILVIDGKIWWDSSYSTCLLYLYHPFPRHLLLATTENEHWLRNISCLAQKGSVSCHDLEDYHLIWLWEQELVYSAEWEGIPLL